MPIRREDLIHILVPPATGVILILLFFAIFDRWTQISDPINSIVAMLTGVIGFAIGAAIDMARARRAKRPDAGKDDTAA